jgi:rhomboid domain-containing protein 1
MDRRGSLTKGMLPLLAIHAVSEYYRLPWKPPVTAALLGANTLIYLRPAFLRHILPSIDQVWFNPHLILKVPIWVVVVIVIVIVIIIILVE